MARKFVTSSSSNLFEGRTKFILSSAEISKNIPHFLGGMTELAACDTGTQTIIADTDCIILEGVREIIPTFGHGTDENTNTLLGAE
jgi:hypothetical protein